MRFYCRQVPVCRRSGSRCRFCELFLIRCCRLSAFQWKHDQKCRGNTHHATAEAPPASATDTSANIATCPALLSCKMSSLLRRSLSAGHLLKVTRGRCIATSTSMRENVGTDPAATSRHPRSTPPPPSGEGKSHFLHQPVYTKEELHDVKFSHVEPSNVRVGGTPLYPSACSVRLCGRRSVETRSCFLP